MNSPLLSNLDAARTARRNLEDAPHMQHDLLGDSFHMGRALRSSNLLGLQLLSVASWRSDTVADGRKLSHALKSFSGDENLLRSIATYPDFLLKAMTARTLGESERASAVGILRTKYLRDKDPLVLASAAAGLIKLGRTLEDRSVEQEGWSVLTDGLKRSSAAERECFADALGLVCNLSDVPRLQELLANERSKYVRSKLLANLEYFCVVSGKKKTFVDFLSDTTLPMTLQRRAAGVGITREIRLENDLLEQFVTTREDMAKVMRDGSWIRPARPVVAVFAAEAGRFRSRQPNQANAWRMKLPHARPGGTTAPTVVTNVEEIRYRDGRLHVKHNVGDAYIYRGD